MVRRVGRNGNLIQIESITFSWCDYDEALGHIERTLRGEDDQNDFAREVKLSIETPEQQGHSCH